MNKHKKYLHEYGAEFCLSAYLLADKGEGAFHIAEKLGIRDKLGRVNVRRADAIIDAGRDWFNNHI